jgi:hypothetical protein
MLYVFRYRVSTATIEGLAVSFPFYDNAVACHFILFYSISQTWPCGAVAEDECFVRMLTLSRPILTPKTVLPLFFSIGIIFAPIGGLLLYASAQVNTALDCIRPLPI